MGGFQKICFCIPALAACAAWAQSIAPVEPALAEIASTRWFPQSAISPDGSRVAYVVELDTPRKSTIHIVDLKAPNRVIGVTAGNGKSVCEEKSVAWSPDSKQIAFLSDCGRKDQLEIYVTPATGGAARQLTHLTGLLANPRWSPDGKRIAVLFTENLPRSAGPTDPVPLDSGVVGAKIYEQRLAVLDTAGAAKARSISPDNMYVYEYDWSPDGRKFAVSAAPGSGDNNWWIAQIYTLSDAGGEMKAVYKPGQQQQIAEPQWSHDGKSILLSAAL
jgi:Tol biopolymer transport system component